MLVCIRLVVQYLALAVHCAGQCQWQGARCGYLGRCGTGRVSSTSPAVLSLRPGYDVQLGAVASWSELTSRCSGCLRSLLSSFLFIVSLLGFSEDV